MLTLSLITAFASDPIITLDAPSPATSTDATPFQRGFVGAHAQKPGTVHLELGTGIVDDTIARSVAGFGVPGEGTDVFTSDQGADAVMAQLGGRVAVSDTFELFGGVNLLQDISDDFAGQASPASATLGGQIHAVTTEALGLAPWFSVEYGRPVGVDRRQLGGQVGFAARVSYGIWTLDLTLPIVRVAVARDPLDLDRSIRYTAGNFAVANTFQVSDKHALRAGLESGLPFASYRFSNGRFSFEPSVGYLFVGMKSGLQF